MFSVAFTWKQTPMEVMYICIISRSTNACTVLEKSGRTSVISTYCFLVTPYDAYSWGNISSCDRLLPDDTMLLPKIMLIYHQRFSVAFTLEQTHIDQLVHVDTHHLRLHVLWCIYTIGVHACISSSIDIYLNIAFSIDGRPYLNVA